MEAKEPESQSIQQSCDLKMKRGHGTRVNGLSILCKPKNERRPRECGINLYVTVSNLKSSKHHNPKYLTTRQFNVSKLGYGESWTKACHLLAKIRGFEKTPQEWIDSLPLLSIVDVKIDKHNQKYGTKHLNPLIEIDH